MGRLFDGTELQVERANPDIGALNLVGDGLAQGKYSIVLEAADRAGVVAESGRGVAWTKPQAAELKDGMLSQIMIDEFLGDGGRRLSEPPTAGSRAGGTLDGVRAFIESGRLERFGVTGVSLSPVYLNPTEP